MLVLLRGAQRAKYQHVSCHLPGQPSTPPLAASRTSTRASIQTSALAMALRNESKEERAARKQAIKEEKAAKRERKQGIVPEDYGQKPCDLCEKQSDLLIRCCAACFCLVPAPLALCSGRFTLCLSGHM